MPKDKKNFDNSNKQKQAKEKPKPDSKFKKK